MTIQSALDRVVQQDQDFCALIEAIYARKYTGAVILHCVDGQPKTVEFPAVQVRLCSRDLTSERSSRTLSPST